MIRETILKIIDNAISKIPELKDQADKLDYSIERPRLKQYGNWSTNIAMAAAPISKKAPMQIAEAVVDNIEDKDGLIEKIEIAKPGFINLTFKNKWYYQVLRRIEELDEQYGEIDFGKGQKILLEYVSANPVGPLHIGHGRWAAIGDTLANTLRRAGYKVETEFYVNNYGRQMMLFYESVVAAYFKTEPPEEGYKGTYIQGIADELRDVLELELNEETRAKFEQLAFELIMEQITESLNKMGVEFDRFFYEKEELHQANEVKKTLDRLSKDRKAYSKDNALWLKTSEYGDEKDRVLVRSNGESTYFAADIAYHKNKLERGFDKLINIWGADHHGYIARVKAAMAALGFDPKKLVIVLGQLVNLLQGGKPVKMSKRTGEFYTLDELIDEVGLDGARYTFLTKSTDSTLDFDIDLVKEQSDKNPVYYVQYAHARISSILRFAAEKGVEYKGVNNVDLGLIKEEHEIDLIKVMEELEDIVATVSKNYTPHLLTAYAQKLATSFHSFYTKSRVIDPANPELTQARLALLKGAQIALKNVLKLLGVNAPEKM